MRRLAALVLCCAPTLACVRTVVSIREVRPDRPTEETDPATAPRAWSATVAPAAEGSRLEVSSSQPCNKRLVITVQRWRATERRGESTLVPLAPSREVLRAWEGECERRVAARVRLAIEGPAGRLSVETNDDGVAIVPLAPDGISRVTTPDGAEIPRTPPAPR